jgi:DNA-binding transcriptional ArsR family regulator
MRGGEAPIRALVYDTKRYRDGLLSLAREVYIDAEFNRIIESLTPFYKKSAEDIRQKLVKTPPLELASEIKGKNVANNQSFKQYYFIPSYFLHDFNISGWEAETSIFMLFYSVNTSERIDHEEIDRFLSLLKSLSDRTRLQILQKLRTAPSYGKKLAEELNLSTASISRQLDQLRTMKLITEEKSDNFKYFRINRNEIDQLIKSIQEFFSEE